MRRVFHCAGLLLLLAGCTREVAVEPAPALEVYSNYATKVPGKWLIVFVSVPMSRDIQLPGRICSEVDYPFDAQKAMGDSVVATFRNLVEEARKGDVNSHGDYTGVIRVSTSDMRLSTHDMETSSGFGFAATVEFDVHMTVTGPQGRLLDAETTGTGTSNGNAGIFCDEGATAFANAARFAMNQAVSDLAVKFAGSQDVRRAYDASRGR